MEYSLLKDTITLLEEFESKNKMYPSNIKGFKSWISNSLQTQSDTNEPDWEGKENDRSPESVISTHLVHLNRYAKSYAKSAIHGSKFSTQEEFIYLINLKAFGAMTKMELIKKNIQDKPTGMLIIKRLIDLGWIKQKDSNLDKRSKIIRITPMGLEALENQMDKIRIATKVVAGDLSHEEKMTLIHLLGKLEHFHHPIFLQNIDSSELLQTVAKNYLPSNN